MIYTLCVEESGFMEDIKVNREQKIVETILILQDGKILSPDIDIDKMRIFSGRENRFIDKYANYMQEDIFQGDILYIR